MKTLLIYPPYSQLLNIPAIGLPYLSAYLKSKGYEASIIDLNIKMYLDTDNKYKKLWHEKNRKKWVNKFVFLANIPTELNNLQEKWVNNILLEAPKFIGFHIASSSQWMSLSLAEKLKKKNNDIVVIFGGPGCYEEKAKQFLETGFVDIVVVGEGEQTLLEIVESYKKTGRIKPCPGAFFKKEGDIVYGGKRELIDDLDALPYPDFSDVIDDYKDFFGDETNLSISWHRGCTHNCAFCFECKFWERARTRSPESICDEFIFQKNKYNIKNFLKADSTLALSQQQLSKTCDLLIEKDVGVFWDSQARTEKYLNEQLLQKLHKAGCKSLSYGIESGSQSVINKMNKSFQIETAEQVIMNTYLAGIQPHLNIMVGSPSETIMDFIKTAWFILKNRTVMGDLNISEALVLPLSDWYIHPDKYGIVIDKTPAMKENYYFMWRTKYFINNRYTRTIKKCILELLASIYMTRGRANRFIGRLGLFIKKNSPNLYSKLKNILQKGS